MRIIIGQFDENLASKVFCCVSLQLALVLNLHISALLSFIVLPDHAAFLLETQLLL